MKALVFHSAHNISVDNVPDPTIEKPTDAVLRVTSTAICGSDLHIVNGFIPQKRAMTLGHEFMGIIEEVGSGVTRLKKGDRVVVPFPIACGACWFCNHALHSSCERSNPNYGPEGGLLTEKGGALFGYTDLYGGYDGGQAEYVRIPYADVGPRKVPDSMTDEQLLFLTDILPTGYSAVEWAGMKGGETVAVIGAGPVGLMAMKCAWLKGASRVIAIDREDYRLERARSAGKAEAIKEGDDVAEKIRSMTDGRGVDVAIDAVGLEAHRTLLDKVSNVIHAQMGSIDALRMAISIVRRGGVVPVVGVYGMSYDNFPIGQMFDKGIRMQLGQAMAHETIDELIDHVAAGKLRLDDVISHRMPLSDAVKGYEIFAKKEDDCVKVVLTP
ncbi:MAG: glutathione-dependent formaldehyde dehydrogenase [Myxococcales bacterium]|nr:glutathione-dependent formaldehyde dehydrogenase [Myxococcales bacterium]